MLIFVRDKWGVLKVGCTRTYRWRTKPRHQTSNWKGLYGWLGAGFSTLILSIWDAWFREGYLWHKEVMPQSHTEHKVLQTVSGFRWCRWPGTFLCKHCNQHFSPGSCDGQCDVGGEIQIPEMMWSWIGMYIGLEFLPLGMIGHSAWHLIQCQIHSKKRHPTWVGLDNNKPCELWRKKASTNLPRHYNEGKIVDIQILDYRYGVILRVRTHWLCVEVLQNFEFIRWHRSIQD